MPNLADHIVKRIDRWKDRHRRARVARGATPLNPILADVIKRDGPISLERYMDIVLHHPEHGYYRFGDPLDTGGDFGTAPEISQLFGEMVGVWCVEAWKSCGSPKAFVLLELGPGRGTMLKTMFRLTDQFDDFHKAMKLYLFESNATFRKLQADKLQAYEPNFIETLDLVPALPLIVVANEFFDTVPIRQFVKALKGWCERLVGLKNDQLVFVHGEPTSLPVDLFQQMDLDRQPEGAVFEVSPQSHILIEKLARHIKQHKGAGLIVDYGYEVAPQAGTLDAWSRHTYTDVLSAPGKVDVTAGVDFQALAKAARKAGAIVGPLLFQGEFLSQYGIGLRAKVLKDHASPAMEDSITGDLYRLTSPNQMGEKFKVLTMSSTKRE